MDNLLVLSKEDTDIYKINGKFYAVVRGFATGNDLGLHNPYNTSIAVFQWNGDTLEASHLPPCHDEEWDVIGGFNVKGDPAGGYDWDDYEKRLDAYFLDTVMIESENSSQ